MTSEAPRPVFTGPGPVPPGGPGAPVGVHPPQAAPAQGWTGRPDGPPPGWQGPDGAAPGFGPGPHGAHGPHPHGPAGPVPPQGQPGPSAAGIGLPTVAGIAGVVLVALGLSIPFDKTSSWVTQTAWSIFALLAALLVVAAPALRGSIRAPRGVWYLTAAAGGALVGYWLLVVLPQVSSNTGFVLTLGVGAVALTAWLSPHRPR
ncbi:hypothetical protein [Nakamurella endophytica]|uniref:Uncharacterized protein n=1 Tax=Nakamurella endophytica TaxID=1748367 RepID=A0A917WB78_9ACTN|nr:hypothetical protein [Nakamurella endophytica]GGL90653.1 hypothetical protein GCM10011594_07850 [Nakamurella endophytica]